MTATAQEVFTETVRALPPSEQFRLAALILQGCPKWLLWNEVILGANKIKAT